MLLPARTTVFGRKYHMWLSSNVLQLCLLNFTLVTVFVPNKSLRSRLSGHLEAMWGTMEWTMVVPSADLWSPASPLSTQGRPVTHSNMGENMLSWASTSQAFSAAACKYVLSFLCQRSAFQPPWLYPLIVVWAEKLRYLCPLLCAFWISKYQGRVGWYPNRQSVVNPVSALRVFRLPRINILVYVSFKVNFIDSCSDITLEQIILFSMYLKRKGDGRVTKPPFREDDFQEPSDGLISEKPTESQLPIKRLQPESMGIVVYASVML